MDNLFFKYDNGTYVTEGKLLLLFFQVGNVANVPFWFFSFRVGFWTWISGNIGVSV